MNKQGAKRHFQNNQGIISCLSNEEFPYRQGIGSVIFEVMAGLGKVPAQIDGITGEIDTYEAFLQRCIRTAITMRSKGVTSDDIITVCSSNHLNTCVPLAACFFLGVKYANTDPNLSLLDTIPLLSQVKPKMIFVSPDAIQLIENALKEINLSAEIVVFGETTEHTQFSEFLRESLREKDFRPVEITDLKQTAAIFFTSGTTGFPKGICVTHLGLLAQTADMRRGSFPSLILLTYSSAYWISLTVCFLITIITKGCRVIVPSFSTSLTWSLTDKFKVTMIILTPYELTMMCENGRPDGVDTSSLIALAAGGSTISQQRIETIKKMLPKTLFLTGYGQTEIGGGSTSFKFIYSDEALFSLTKPTSCGLPLPGYFFKIVDPETKKVLGPNEHGEIRVKTEYQMNGYYNIDSSDAWDSDGFLKTGDIGYYDEDYCFYVVDRIKDMLKYQGWQIAPAKLEAILMTHPAVVCAVVVGIPHPINGDHPKGIVTVGDSCLGITPDEIEKYVEEKVSEKYRLRAGVKIVDSLPTTPTGKFKRRFLRDLVIAGKL